jgi:methionyl-tRNA formyltransferase
VRIIFMGTPAYAVPTLDAVVAAGHEVLAVVAQPDRPQGRGQQLHAPPTIERARALALPTRQPKAVRSGPFPEWMESCGADVAVVVAYGRILTPRLLAAPRLGCVNGHASLLPRYRGAAPIQWSVIQGERTTGVCTMQMDEGLDTGAVLLRRELAIGADETAGELSPRLAALTAALMVETLAGLSDIVPQPQDHAASTLAPLLQKSDGELDWTWPAQKLHNRVRGVNPWPGGQTTFRGQPLKVHRTRVVDFFPDLAPRGGPGAVVEAGGRVVVLCGDVAVELVEVQLPGKKAMDGASFANGSRLEVGEVLGAPLG